MKRSGSVKFPNSVQLFKFCQKVLSHQKGEKVHDQEVGGILDFNPSDCSHWKRGEKNIKSVFALAKLAETLRVEPQLIHDIASGQADLDEAYFEYLEAINMKTAIEQARSVAHATLARVNERIEAFVTKIHEQSEFATPPLYLPEILRFFSYISTQPMDMVDKLSRILRIKPGQYSIHYRKGDLKSQTRMSMAKDLAKIIFQGERARYPELGSFIPELSAYEEVYFVANLMLPKAMLTEEITKLDSRRNVVADLATLFWVPKVLVGFQIQELLRPSFASFSATVTKSSSVEAREGNYEAAG